MTFSTDVLEAAMLAAIAEARQAAEEGELPYGAVVVSASGKIVARAQDRVARDGDPTKHAEIEAVRLAVQAVGPDLSGHALVSNVEPCAMCATAAWWARISAVGYGISQADLFACRPDAMDEPGLTVDQTQAPYSRRMTVVTGLEAAVAWQLWKG
jgi:tRNA(Arg) A34 adenosine deaminase TadA